MIEIRSPDGRKPANAGDDRAVGTAGAVDDPQIAVLIPTTDDPNVRIAGIKHQIAGNGVSP